MPKCGLREVPNWVKRVKNSIYWVQVVHGASKWLEQGGTSFERYTGHQDWPLCPHCTTLNAQMWSREVPNWVKRVKNSIYLVQVVQGASVWDLTGTTFWYLGWCNVVRMVSPDCLYTVPILFHLVPAIWGHHGPMDPINAVLGHFWPIWVKKMGQKINFKCTHLERDL